MSVCIGKGPGYLMSDTESIMERRADIWLNSIQEISALKIFHDDELSAAVLLYGKNCDDILMVKASHRAGLTKKSLEKGRVAA